MRAKFRLGQTTSPICPQLLCFCLHRPWGFILSVDLPGSPTTYESLCWVWEPYCLHLILLPCSSSSPSPETSFLVATGSVSLFAQRGVCVSWPTCCVRNTSFSIPTGLAKVLKMLAQARLPLSDLGQTPFFNKSRSRGLPRQLHEEGGTVVGTRPATRKTSVSSSSFRPLSGFWQRRRGGKGTQGEA